MSNHILIPLATAVRLEQSASTDARIDWGNARIVHDGECAGVCHGTSASTCHGELNGAPVASTAGRRVVEEGAACSPGVYLDADGDVVVVKGTGAGEQVTVGREDLYAYRDSADADGYKGTSRYISWPLTQLHVFEEGAE